MKKIILCMLLVLVLGVSGCGKGDSKSSEKEGKTEKVVVGTEEIAGDECIARRLDYLQEEMGTTVEVKSFDSGKELNTALAAGSIDFALMGSCPAALAVSQELDVEIVWMHNILAKSECLVVRKETGVESIEDLKGKNIATPFASSSHYGLIHALESHGLTAKDVNLMDMQTSEIFAAWQNKEIDAAYLWDPILSQLNDSVYLYSSKDAADDGSVIATVELVRKQFAEEHPEFVTGYIKACQKAIDLYKNNTDDAIKAVMEEMELDKETAEKQMGSDIILTAEEQLSDKYFGTSEKKGKMGDILYQTAEFLKQQGSLQEIPDKQLFYDSINPKFIEESVND